ncbi:hypothetical protein HRI91_005165 [Salmonella enterica]|nr:hypothetical protein [Salmonella enterica]
MARLCFRLAPLPGASDNHYFREPIREWNILRNSGVALPTRLRFTGIFLGRVGIALTVSPVSTTAVTLIS